MAGAGSERYDVATMAGKTYEGLWKHFVPRDGPPRTAPGEVLRAVARISHEVSINEGAGWDEDHDALVAVLKTHLVDGAGIDAEASAATARDLAVVSAFGASKGGPNGAAVEAVARLKACVVAWCNQRLSV